MIKSGDIKVYRIIIWMQLFLSIKESQKDNLLMSQKYFPFIPTNIYLFKVNNAIEIVGKDVQYVRS